MTTRPVILDSRAINFQALPPLSLYIHIPWCVRKCPYCDFNSHEARGAFPEKKYVAALIRDLELALPLIWGRKIYTVFFGGGTPSLLSGESVDEILRNVRMLLPLDPGAEITLEANPGTVEAARFAAYREAEVNRLSLGIQSFNDVHLQALGRIHSAEEAKRAIEIARQHFDNINLDLMYALPHQTLDEALRDVQTALSFAPQHLSCYHLTLEPKTMFHRNPPALPDDDASSDMQQRIEEMLAAHGYLHYETSAFARCPLPSPDGTTGETTSHLTRLSKDNSQVIGYSHSTNPANNAGQVAVNPPEGEGGKVLLRKRHFNCRSRHNMNYWQFGDYLGIGAGAHSKLSFHDKVMRQVRYQSPQTYLQQVALDAPIKTEHQVARDELAFEFMMNALRLNEGVDSALFNERTSLRLHSIRRELGEAEQRGLLFRDHKRIAPTKMGQRFLNDLLEIFLADR